MTLLPFEACLKQTTKKIGKFKYTETHRKTQVIILLAWYQATITNWFCFMGISLFHIITLGFGPLFYPITYILV